MRPARSAKPAWQGKALGRVSLMRGPSLLRARILTRQSGFAGVSSRLPTRRPATPNLSGSKRYAAGLINSLAGIIMRASAAIRIFLVARRFLRPRVQSLKSRCCQSSNSHGPFEPQNGHSTLAAGTGLHVPNSYVRAAEGDAGRLTCRLPLPRGITNTDDCSRAGRRDAQIKPGCKPGRVAWVTAAGLGRQAPSFGAA